MDSDPFSTQRDVGSAVVAELSAAGFADADEIGRGGFGIVFRCRQTALDRMVAVKVLTTQMQEDRERFVREQRAMGRLTGHPNVVGVLEVGQTESGCPYLVMQYHQRGSLEARIRRLGRLPVEEVLHVGVKIAGALEAAHRREILHRDVKPANILLTDYGEPALADFGIAHFVGGFKTATGTFTGSPAFTAPEVLSGDPPSAASDVYELGATLFAALTGHAAYERKSGEQVVAQFLRIASEPVPDLRDSGIPADVSALVEKAMSRDAWERPSAADLGEELAHVATRGLAATQIPPLSSQPLTRAVDFGPRRPGNLPLELTGFIGRLAELAEVTRLLSASRLVTLTGIGGVGKTRLALRAATETHQDFPDGAWMIELSELRDPSLITEVVAAGVGLRDESGRSLRDVLVEFLRSRRLLLILDNCEQVVDEAAKLAEVLLRACPELHILATGRERLGIGGEAVQRVSPLAVPDDVEPTLRGVPGYDSVALFVERGAAALPGFQLTEDNQATVARICSRVDGLPLAIELAAARLRTMSSEQILARLDDRYTLLAHGSRVAPARQQSLTWCIDWSYDLCTPAEQRLWTGLSVFAGSFELEAAEDICGRELAPGIMVDLLAALVDKSILIRTEANGQVRFGLLDTLRDYGREKLDQTSERPTLRRRHMDWYRRLVADMAADWFSSRQAYWLKRIEAEKHNLREAWEFALTDSPPTLLAMCAGVYPYAIGRGLLREMRRWLDRALTAAPVEPSEDRIKALHGATLIAGLQGNVPVATARAGEAQALAELTSDRTAQGWAAIADGFAALVGGDADRALSRAEDAVAATDDPSVRAPAMMLQGWAFDFSGELGGALICQEKALAIAESAGEVVTRSYALWAVGIGWWRNGKPERAEQLLRECLQLSHLIDDPRNGAACLEALAWVAGAKNDPRRAVLLMASAEALGNSVGVPPAVLPDLAVFHEQCDCCARDALGAEAYAIAHRQGFAMDFGDAVAYALTLDALS
ncbi:protein kinase [Mycobacterium sp.]|jgi:non-specific serine/threonine protein kinase|uniref:protein kinase domain-containing protein n=1 Tax=Mycobacterium sp. TaxID=1785 RepID=UPI00333F5BDD|nr:putative ATPase [Mycobacterium sp.]